VSIFVFSQSINVVFPGTASNTCSNNVRKDPDHVGRKLLAEAAAAKARSEPAVLRKAAGRAWKTRWTTFVSVSVQNALAATLVDDGTCHLDAADGPAPLAVDVWLSSRSEPGHTTSTAECADPADLDDADRAALPVAASASASSAASAPVASAVGPALPPSCQKP